MNCWSVRVPAAKHDDDRRRIRFPRDPAAGVTLRSYRTLDGQNAADIELRQVEVTAAIALAPKAKRFAAIEAAHAVALSALCAEAVGIMKAVNAATLEYTRSRKQFGQPIAKFQVLQHRMADMFLHSEQATLDELPRGDQVR